MTMKKLPALVLIGCFSSSLALASASGEFNLPDGNIMLTTYGANDIISTDDPGSEFVPSLPHDIQMDPDTERFEIPVSRDLNSTGRVSVNWSITNVGAGGEALTGKLVWDDGVGGTKNISIPVDDLGMGYGTLTLHDPAYISGTTVDPALGLASADVTFVPVLLVGESWTGGGSYDQSFALEYQGTPDFDGSASGFLLNKYYEDWLFRNSYYDIIANLGYSGSGLSFNTYFDAMFALEEQIHVQLDEDYLVDRTDYLGGRNVGHARIVIALAGGTGNDFAHMKWNPSTVQLDRYQRAVMAVSDTIVQSGAIPVWGSVPLFDALASYAGWGATQEQVRTDFNAWLEQYCDDNGFGFIDLDAEFVHDPADGHLKSPDLLTTYTIADKVHLNHVGTDHLASLVKQEVDEVIVGGPGTLSLDADSLTATENGEYCININRTDGRNGWAKVLVYVDNTSLDITYPSGYTHWDDNEQGVKTKCLTIGEVSANSETTINLWWAHGELGPDAYGPNTPGLDIAQATLRVTDVPPNCLEGAQYLDQTNGPYNYSKPVKRPIFFWEAPVTCNSPPDP